MTDREMVAVALAVAVVMVSFPFVTLFMAKLISYGWASGRDRFERDRKLGD